MDNLQLDNELQRTRTYQEALKRATQNGSATREAQGQASSLGQQKRKGPADDPFFVAPQKIKVVPLPLEALPIAVKDFVDETAKALHCPPDFIAIPSLVGAGAAIGASCELELKRGWRESANLYASTVGDPGSKKSPAQEKALAPMYRRQRQAKVLYLKECEKYVQARTEFELQLSTWEKNVKKGLATVKEKPEEPEAPVMLELYTTDATREAVADLLERNPDGIVYTNDEVSAWAQSFNQYRNGKGADSQFWLSGWNRAQIKINRKGRKEPQIIDRPFLAVVGGIQPDILPALSNEKGREDGQIHRVLFAFPESLPLKRTDDEVGVAVEDGYYTLFERLWALRKKAREDKKPWVLRLTPDAKQTFDDFRDAHYAEQDDEAFPAVLRGPWAKREAYCARLALIIHLCRFVMDETESRDVDEVSLAAAWTLIDYFKSHDRKVYARLHTTADDRRAAAAVEWIERHGGKATARDLHRYKVTNIKATSEAKKLLRELVDRGYGTLATASRREIFTLASSAKK